MAKANQKNKSIYTARSTFVDREKLEKYAFSELSVKIQTLDTALLLLSSLEDMVLITVFKHITEFIRKQDENITEIREKNMLDLMLDKDLYQANENVLVRRFCLYNFSAMLEKMNTLLDLTLKKNEEIMEVCMRFYLFETDEFGLEYLSVIINKCLCDPQLDAMILQNPDFLEKYFALIASTENPDTLWHSLEILNKLLLVQNTANMRVFVLQEQFPIERILCEMTSDFPEIRSAVLNLIKTLIADTYEEGVFAKISRAVLVLQQLTKMFCNEAMSENIDEVIDVLATAIRSERMAQLFFEHNLFDKIIQNMDTNSNVYELEMKCKIVAIFCECAKYVQYLYRLHLAHVVDMFLDCLLQGQPPGPATHVITGLNRLMKFTESANRVVDSYELGVIPKLLKIMLNDEINIKTREQSSELIGQLLLHAYHPTGAELIKAEMSIVLGDIFGQNPKELSIDFILSMLSNIECLAQNEEYRNYLGQHMLLTRNLAILLQESFSAAILVTNIFRCLCTLLDEPNVREWLLTNRIANSINRGLKSFSNLVKTAVTNFIMQTTRFPEYVLEYVDAKVLEVLIFFQKHAFCVSTWVPAIDAILSKCPSLKFCIRNNLGFTDTTAGIDFMVSKKKFEDFRIFQSILVEEVSPYHPVLVLTFHRPTLDEDLMVEVPLENLLADGVIAKKCWCYTRQPSDEYLPVLLDELLNELEMRNLGESPIAKAKRCIDFDNMAKRAKVVAEIVANHLGHDLKTLDLNSAEECSHHTVCCHLKECSAQLHCTIIPLGMVRTGCQFERAVLFKGLCDQIGLPCTLQRSVDGLILFNELPLPVELDLDIHCDNNTMKFMPWRMLRPTHIVDLMYNVGELYPLQSRQALQYLKFY